MITENTEKSFKKGTILIADDTKLNHRILRDILSNNFDIISAMGGAEALQILNEKGKEISLLLLDIMMPDVDGFAVLEGLRESNLIEEIPVIMISANTEAATINKAYEMGAWDYITRPFNATAVRHRAINTVLTFAKEKKLTAAVLEQVLKKENGESMMISILSHIVEFRNGESGLHVLHINAITELLLRQLVKSHPEYHFSHKEISQICLASSLHDIGKIAIPEEILNKPGRLTPEEFRIMKTHAAIGSDLISHSMEAYPDEPLIQYAYGICRWHHERWDGSGYPDGLKGDSIPIYAQIVSIADVYDALTSERVYKPPFTHEQALYMIDRGECGIFNPLLLKCLHECADNIRSSLENGFDSVNKHQRLEEAVHEAIYVAGPERPSVSSVRKASPKS